MKQFACIILLISFISLTYCQDREYIYDDSKRITHAFINGEVRLNESSSLTIDANHCQLIVQLRYSRDDRPRSIGQIKIKLNQTHVANNKPFRVQFKLKYPVSKISPHNTYILSAQIRNQRKKLLYIGDLGLPVTEKPKQQAKFLIIHLIPTRMRQKCSQYNFVSCSSLASWYQNIKKLSLLAYKVTQLAGTEEVNVNSIYRNLESLISFFCRHLLVIITQIQNQVSTIVLSVIQHYSSK